MRCLRSAVWLLAFLVLGTPDAVRAQQNGSADALGPFAAHIARLWEAGDADGIAELVGRGGRVSLDLGTPGGGAQERHAAAALRALFSERESVSARPQRAAVSGGDPPRGFVELVWASRARGAKGASVARVYFGAIWEDGAWRLRELRLLR